MRHIFRISIGIAFLAGVYFCAPVFVYCASILHYLLLCLYGVTFAPIVDTVAAYKKYRQYEQVLQHVEHERAQFAQQLIEAQAQLVRYGDMADCLPARETCAECCRIIYKQLAQHDGFFIIDKGSRHGITTDMVAVYKDMLIGRVTQVYPLCARVMPITHEHCKVPIVCAQSRAHGVHYGNKLDFVSHLEPLVRDELVLTSGDGLLFPEGLALGTIAEFSLHDQGFLYDVHVKPLYQLDDITCCTILTKGTAQAVS